MHKKQLILALLASFALSGAAQAALQGRDLNGSIDSFEAYYDTVLDITWLDGYYYNTNLSGTGYDTGSNDADGKTTWTLATAWAANLSIVDSVNNITYDNWRLPAADPVNGSSYVFNSSLNFTGNYDSGFNITSPNNEMAHLFYVTLGNPGYKDTNGVLTGCYDASTSKCLDNTGPFKYLQADGYWAEPQLGVDGMGVPYVFQFYFQVGSQISNPGSMSMRALAVSPGDIGIAAVPEADTWVMLLTGLGLVGAVTRRRLG
ncbi:MAG: hypothetical protein PHR30_18920 [Gallionellaceae bacterium]|nr:hypothetical protein [Gallionellaceae bacterium]